MIRDILDVASPRFRVPWDWNRRRKPKPMTADETAALMLALAADRAADNQPLRYKAIFNAIGEKAWNVLNSLKVQGALHHAGYNDWRITEKGRIAATLAMAKDPALAAAAAGPKTHSPPAQIGTRPAHDEKAQR